MPIETITTTATGRIDHQPAGTVVLLVGDPDPDIAIRAMRAAGRSSNSAAVERIAGALARPETASIVAAEAVRALLAVGSPAASSALDVYRGATASQLPHRGEAVVHSALGEGPQT